MALQGVEYPASIQGFLASGDTNGSQLMAQLVGEAMQKCPNTKVVISGYRYALHNPSAGLILMFGIVREVSWSIMHQSSSMPRQPQK